MARSLAYTHRTLSKQWHPTKNGELAPRDVTAGSGRVVWWRCAGGSDHVWQAPVIKRARYGHGCPFCSGHRVLPETSLATNHPEIAAQWHPTRNGGLRPEEITPGSGRKVWWKCDAAPDHEWAAYVSERVKYQNPCPFCAGRMACKTTSLAALRPALAAEWHPTGNGQRTPADVVPGSGFRAWWKCAAGPDHEWAATVRSRGINGTGCPFCDGKKVSVTNSLQTLHPELAAEWHPTKNGSLTPADVVARSGKRAWWICPEGPDHEWKTIIAHRTANGSGCPFCAGKRASVTNSLASLYPVLSAQWHPTKNGRKRPEDTLPGSDKKAWWKCPAGPDHEWQAVIQARAGRGIGCPFCAGRRVSVTNSLHTLFPKVAREWDPDRNGDLTPSDVLAAATKRYWWRCALGHAWQAAVRERTVMERGCPMCARGATGTA